MESEPCPDLPPEVAETLAGLSDHQLRAVAHHVQALLADRYVGQPEIEALPGEEIVSTVDHGRYTEVLKRQPCAVGCTDCPHGPYLYHVTREVGADGDESLNWRYLGVAPDR